MKLSVIIPVYNLENYIGDCLSGLLQQDTSFDYELVVANDCSADNSLAIIQDYQAKYPGKIVCINNSQNQRLANNMKILLAAAKGDYIAYMDGDDVALPGKLQAQVDHLDQHPGCSMVYHESEVFDTDTDEVKSHYVRDYYNRKFIPQQANIEHLIRYGSFFQASTLMFRRHSHLVETVDDKCKIILDQPFQVLNAGYLGGTIDRLDKVLGRYRIHSNSFGARTLQDHSRREQVLADQLQAISNGHRFGIDPKVIAEGEAHYYFATAMFFLKLGDQERFQKYIIASYNRNGFFDTRHRYLYENKDDFSSCSQFLGVAA